MKQIEIIDNYLPDHTFGILQQQLLSQQFPWFFKDTIVDYNHPTDYQFIHVFQLQSPYYSYIKPLLHKINPTQLIRCKLNLRPITQQHQQSPYHLDQRNTNHKVAIYYINTNNGYTIFEHNKQQVQSKQNRLVIFDGNIKHAGVSTTNTKRRVVLNINYI